MPIRAGGVQVPSARIVAPRASTLLSGFSAQAVARIDKHHKVLYGARHVVGQFFDLALQEVQPSLVAALEFVRAGLKFPVPPLKLCEHGIAFEFVYAVPPFHPCPHYAYASRQGFQPEFDAPVPAAVFHSITPIVFVRGAGKTRLAGTRFAGCSSPAVKLPQARRFWRQEKKQCENGRELMPLFRFFFLALALQTLAIAPAAAKRVALVIGNSAYVQAPQLANPVNDAGDMARALAQAGFDVILGLDLDRRAFDEKLRAFANSLEDADTAVLFYAGHGLQVSGRNYLVPVDAALKSERDLDFEAVNLDFVLRQMEVGREGKTNIVFLDACRDNPLSRNLARSMGTRSAAIGKGLAEVQTGVGTFIAYSTQPGNVALDGTGRNSPFTAALASRLPEAGRNLTALMIEVRNDVLKTTDGKQVPWDHSALTSEFSFQPGAKTASEPAPSPETQELIQARLRAIEEQMRSKADRQQTISLVKLEQLKERVRQIEVAMKEDQQRIFDTYNRKDLSGGDLSMKVGSIQMQMARRGQEKKQLQEEIAKLKAELGMTDADK